VSVERQVVRAFGPISAATGMSRVLGYVRDVVIAVVFGAGPVTDAFFVAFRIPNVLRRLLAEGALSTAVVPVFTDYAATRPRPEVLRMLRAVFGAALLALAVTTLLGVMAAPALLWVMAPGFGADARQMALATALTQLMFPYLLLVGLAALAMGALNAHGRFFAAALGPAVLNVGMITGGLGLARYLDPPVFGLAVGVLMGGVGQVAVQVPSLRRAGLLVSPAVDLSHPALTRVGRLLLPAVFGLAAVQVTVFVNTLLASLLPAGSISFLYYADRVMELPLGVFGIALASAALPAMARQAATGETREVAGTLNFTLRLAAFITVPAAVGLVMLRVPVIRVLFQWGRFEAPHTTATADALAAYAVGLAGFTAARIAAQVFYAVGTPGVAVRLGFASVLANVVAALVLMRPLAHVGLALASSVGAYVNAALLLVAARRRFGPLGGRALARSLGRTLGASAAVAVWCALWLRVWPSTPSREVEGAWLLATIAGGIAVYVAAARVLAPAELGALLGMLPRRRGR
jgi:putative peptidoglycan lipid II flippase